MLLGIRTTPRVDLKTSSAELVYGAPLTLPGDFIVAQDTPLDNVDASLLPNMGDRVRKLVPKRTRLHVQPRSSVTSDIMRSDYVFVRRDSHRSPLSQHNEGPFHVVERNDKFFKLEMGGKTESVSLDRLKPAFLDFTEPVQVADASIVSTSSSGGSSVTDLVTTGNEQQTLLDS